MLGYLALVPIGLLVGYFVGIVGICAGVILMPLLLGYGFTLTQAVAAGLFLQVVPQSLPGLWVYWKHGEVRLWECVVLAVASALGELLEEVKLRDMVLKETGSPEATRAKWGSVKWLLRSVERFESRAHAQGRGRWSEYLGNLALDKQTGEEEVRARGRRRGSRGRGARTVVIRNSHKYYS